MKEEVFKRLVKSARAMEWQMDLLHRDDKLTEAECQFQIIQAIYGLMDSKQYQKAAWA